MPSTAVNNQLFRDLDDSQWPSRDSWGRELEKRLVGIVGDEFARVLKGGRFTLPRLSYGLGDLEPHCSETSLRQHYEGYSGRCVSVLNGAIERVRSLPPGDMATLRTQLRLIGYASSDHALHNLFWRSMVPGGAEIPDNLAEIMFGTFRSVHAAKGYFAGMCKASQRRGWAVMAVHPARNKLTFFVTGEIANVASWPVVPLLVCDLWEHAYNLQYGSNCGQWVDAFMQIANWRFAGDRLDELRSRAAHGRAA